MPLGIPSLSCLPWHASLNKSNLIVSANPLYAALDQMIRKKKFLNNLRTITSIFTNMRRQKHAINN